MRRNWVALSFSATAHLLLIAGAVALSLESPKVSRDRSVTPAAPARRVDMIYVPPADPAPAVPRARPVTPPPLKPQKAPEPEPNAPPEATRSPGTETDDQDRGNVEPSAVAPAPKQPLKEEVSTALETEARRIFGRPRHRTPAGAGPQAVRPMEAYLPEHPRRCVPHETEPGEEGTPMIGTVVGRIFKQDSGRPLVGAHLQMLGAPYVAFTDDKGEYRFRFDLAMVDNCRTQYVRVTAPGYESRLLVLVVGENIQSEDVRLRRR